MISRGPLHPRASIPDDEHVKLPVDSSYTPGITLDVVGLWVCCSLSRGRGLDLQRPADQNVCIYGTCLASQTRHYDSGHQFCRATLLTVEDLSGSSTPARLVMTHGASMQEHLRNKQNGSKVVSSKARPSHGLRSLLRFPGRRVMMETQQPLRSCP